MDAQSVKGTNTARQKGRDAGKRISGIKRHITVNTQGLPPAMAVTAACKACCAMAAMRASPSCRASEIFWWAYDGANCQER